MQNLQLNALFGFYLAANPDDDVLRCSSESQDYPAGPLWKRKNWVHAVQLEDDVHGFSDHSCPE